MSSVKALLASQRQLQDGICIGNIDANNANNANNWKYFPAKRIQSNALYPQLLLI